MAARRCGVVWCLRARHRALSVSAHDPALAGSADPHGRRRAGRSDQRRRLPRLTPRGGSGRPAVGSETPLSFFGPASDQANAVVARRARARLVGDQRARPRALGEPRREVDRAAVVVAPAPQRLPVGDAGVQRRELPRPRARPPPSGASDRVEQRRPARARRT